jgi:hypothetical protein
LPGLKHVIADFLPSPLLESTDTVAATAAADPVNFKEMAAKQNCCAETQSLLGGTSLKLAFYQTGAQCPSGDISTGVFRPIVPLKFRKYIFSHFQNVAHSNRLASHRIISSKFVWRGLSSDITTWNHVCLACQRGKIHRHTCLAPQPIPIPQWCFSHLYVDLVGPLQYSNSLIIFLPSLIAHPNGWKLFHFLICPDGMPLTFSWISCFSVPETITSDRRPQFTSNLWFKLCEMLNISHRQSTAYHPESNGAVKRLHRRLKDAHAPPLRLGPRSYPLTPWTLRTAERRHWSFPGRVSFWCSNCVT